MEGLGRGVEVVAVELYGEASATVIMNGLVPAAADTEIRALWDDMHQSFVVDTAQQFRGLVRRVVIDDDHVEPEVGLLLEGTVHGVADGLLTVIDGDDDGRLHIELLFVEVRTAVVGGVDLRPDLLQMGGGRMFHLDLYLAIAGIHVVELLHARGPGVCLFLRIEFLLDVEDPALAAEEEAQGIESRILVVALSRLHGEGVEQ